MTGLHPAHPHLPSRSGFLHAPHSDHPAIGADPPRTAAPASVAAVQAAPLAIAAIAASHAVALHTGGLSTGALPIDRGLLLASLVVLVAAVALVAWQHRAVVQPLQRLADPAARRRAGSVASVREIAIVAERCERSAAPPDRDPLTGLLSLAGLNAVAPAPLRRAQAAGAQLLLIVIDIARLREVNGLHGFGFGDELLRQFGRRLAATADGAALAARIGGDRFALLLPHEGPPATAGVKVASVTDVLARPFQITGCEIAVLAHAGAALFPDHANSVERLMRAAELALESCRRGGGRWRLFDPLLNRAAVARKALEKELRRAVEQQELILHYQPQVDLPTGRVVAVEALLRWQHPERGLVPPQTFIPVAEASGLIRPIGAWVLTEACRATRRWRDRGIEIGISVNMSAAQLKHQDLPATVAQALATSGLPPDVLELELTESMFVDPTQLAMHRAVQAIAAMGVRLAIDDFGTGYSSLGYLKRLPVHKIKIDKSFVRELGRDDGDAAIVRSIIGLGQTFGKKVLAEGVENAAQYRFLLAEGCHEGQGYHFARPMPESGCVEFLRRHVAAPAAETLELLAS